MLLTIVTALLPIIVTLLLGFFAGWHKDFSQEQAGVLNHMVMLYALPMLLVAGILSTPLHELTSNLGVLLWIAVGMIGGWVIVFVVAHYLFRSGARVSALRALAIAGPAVPFVGPTVLGTVFPTDAPLAIAVASLLMNIVQVPVTLVLLATGIPAAGSPAGAAPVPRSGWQVAVAALRHSVRQPVVWAPIAAFVLLLIGLDMPTWLKGSFTTLGQATGGVALFAVGAVLYAQRVGISVPIVVNVVAKNLLVPGLVLLAMILFGVSGDERALTTITLAIPTASIPVIFAVQYRVAVKEMASTLFFSTVASVATMAGFIWLTGA